MARQATICGVVSVVLANPVQAECFDCNYGLAIYVLGSFVIAGAMAAIGLVWFLASRRVPWPVVAIFLLAATPPAIIVALDWAGLI